MLNYLKELNKYYILIIGLMMVTVVGVFDNLTGVEYAFSIFYLLPIAFVTWFSGWNLGFLIGIVCSIAWFWGEMQYSFRYTNPTAPYWNVLVRFGLFSIVVFLISRIKKMENTLEEKINLKTLDLTLEIAERKKAQVELKRQSDKLSDLANRIQNIKEEENTKIAREVHDELGQALTAIKIDLMWLAKKYSTDSEIIENLHNITETVDDTIKTVRKISSSLRPKLLDELGFSAAIERYLKDFEIRTGIGFDFICPENTFKFDNEESNALFRIFQEALTNIARHSRASFIDVRMFNDETGNFNLVISDNGGGLQKNYESKRETLGILGMKERAHSIGGNISIESGMNSGTLVKVKLPNKKIPVNI